MSLKINRRSEIKVIGRSRMARFFPDPELSILIPTYNRSGALRHTLSALTRQHVDVDQYEIVVVDDGSTDNTSDMLSSFSEKTDKRFRYAVLRKNGGPARARNIGLTLTKGTVVLNLGDDIEPHSSLIHRHIQWHRNHPDERDALLGLVTFPDSMRPSGFMQWLECGGRQFYFNYAVLKPHRSAPSIFFYTCNVSLKTSMLEKSGWFDESFPYASHEDLELGKRLTALGMRLIYEPNVKGYHWHFLTLESTVRRVYFMGYSAHLYWQKIGNSGSVIRRIVRTAAIVFCSLPLMIFYWRKLRKKNYSQEKKYPLHWHVLLFLSFFIGLSDRSRGYPVRPELMVRQF